MGAKHWLIQAALVAAVFVTGCARPEEAEAKPNMQKREEDTEQRWLQRVYETACDKGMPVDGLLLVVSFSKQDMRVLDGGRAVKTYTVSTSRFGVGNREGSNRTPRGLHRVAERFGKGHPAGRVFQARAATSTVIPRQRWRDGVTKDRVLTRILWLDGVEPGINHGKGIGSHERYIYIHGTNQEHLLGRPASHGCIRMGNDDVIELFDLTQGRDTWCWISQNVAVEG